MAKIQLNGKKISIKSNFSIQDLLKKYKLGNKKVAIEHNGIIIPKISSSESGQLITFPNLRVEPFGNIYNFISKLYYKFFFQGKKNIIKLSETKKSVEFDFTDNIPILFLGRATLHGSRGFDEIPEGIRITMLTHFFDPSPKYGIGNLIRLIRNR